MKKEYESNAQLVSLYAKRFESGRCPFLGFGSEKKWYSISADSPQGEWDRVAELMMIKFGESGHPFFDDNKSRDQRFEELIKSFSAGLKERDANVDKTIEGMEKKIEIKIEEKFAGLETRISAIERGALGEGYNLSDITRGKPGYALMDCKAVLHGFKTDSREEEDVKTIVMQTIKTTGMKEEHVIDYPAIPITHVFVEFHDTRTRDRFVRSAGMQKFELDGRRINISQPDERFDRKRLGYVKYAINKKTNIELHWINLNLQKKYHDRRTDSCKDRRQWSPQIQQIRGFGD